MANIKDIDEALKAKKLEAKKAEELKRIKKLMKVANQKANDILSFFEKDKRSVRWVELFLQNLSGTIDSSFLARRMKTKVKELAITVDIKDKSGVADKDENNAYTKVLKIIGDLTVLEATKILEGMNSVVNGKLNKEKNEKKINELEIIFSENEEPKNKAN